MLKLTLGGRVDGDVGVVDEAEERLMMPLISAHRGHQRLGRKQRWRVSGAPLLELLGERPDELASMLDKSVTDKAELVSACLVNVHGREEAPAFGCLAAALSHGGETHLDPAGLFLGVCAGQALARALHRKSHLVQHSRNGVIVKRHAEAFAIQLAQSWGRSRDRK